MAEKTQKDRKKMTSQEWKDKRKRNGIWVNIYNVSVKKYNHISSINVTAVRHILS